MCGSKNGSTGEVADCWRTGPLISEIPITVTNSVLFNCLSTDILDQFPLSAGRSLRVVERDMVDLTRTIYESTNPSEIPDSFCNFSILGWRTQHGGYEGRFEVASVEPLLLSPRG